jgi:uncharacterized protein YacL
VNQNTQLNSCLFSKLIKAAVAVGSVGSTRSLLLLATLLLLALASGFKPVHLPNLLYVFVVFLLCYFLGRRQDSKNVRVALLVRPVSRRKAKLISDVGQATTRQQHLAHIGVAFLGRDVQASEPSFILDCHITAIADQRLVKHLDHVALGCEMHGRIFADF